MSCCDDSRPCAPSTAGSGLSPRRPGRRSAAPPRRRVRGVRARPDRRRRETGVPGGDARARLGCRGRPDGSTLVDLWAYVAEIVAAYAELTAAEAYLGTASDWTDLRRLADLVGYRPRPARRRAGLGPGRGRQGHRSRSPGGHPRPGARHARRARRRRSRSSTDTQLHSDWNALTATWVPVAQQVEGRRLRFLGDPGFRVGDLVLFVREDVPPSACVPPNWGTGWSAEFWAAVLALAALPLRDHPHGEPLAARGGRSRCPPSSARRSSSSTASSVSCCSSETDAYAAYRVLATAGQARRLDQGRDGHRDDGHDRRRDRRVQPGRRRDASIVLDAALDNLSAGQTVAVVAWEYDACDIVAVKAHKPFAWEVAPGTTDARLEARVRSRRADADRCHGGCGDRQGRGARRSTLSTGAWLRATTSSPTAAAGRDAEPAAAVPGAEGRLRTRIAAQTSVDDKLLWEVLACKRSSTQETKPGDEPDAASGLIVELVDGPPAGRSSRLAPARTSLAIRHGTTANAVLGSGDATQPGQRFALPGRADRLRPRHGREPRSRRRSSGSTASAGPRSPSLYGQGECRGLRRSARCRTAACRSSSGTASRAPGCRPAAAT